MISRRILGLAASLLVMLVYCFEGSAKDVKDTLFSNSGDRIIVSYTQNQSGGQMTVRFNSVLKKLSDSHLKKYKKLDEVAVVIFERTGNYRDMKFDGMSTTTFMVPAEVNYSPSADGYLLLHDNPMLQFNVASDEVQISIPLYLAHYEGKHHYKVFSQCGSLLLTAKAGGAKGSGGRTAGQAQQDDVVISSEELVDEGISPADEAAIRINSLQQMLEKATKLPFSEELTHEASMLRELRFKITDESVGKQIAAVLAAYDDKKQQLEQKADAAQQAAAEKAAADAQQAQARQDSIAAQQAQQASDDKKSMMWLIGGLGAFFALFIGGKQVLQTIKNNKMQKMQQQMQQQMLKNIQNMANGANPMPQTGDNPMQNIPGGQQVQQQAMRQVQQQVDRQVHKAEQQTSRAMSKESEAAQQRLREILAGKKGQVPNTEQPTTAGGPEMAAAPKISITPGRKPSLNDQIPTKFKRMQKKSGGDSPKK